MMHSTSVWTTGFYYGYLGYYYNAGSLCCGKTSVREF